MPMPLRRNAVTHELEPTEIFSVRLSSALILELRVLFSDPRNGRGRYRTFGRMIERALSDWLEQQKVRQP